MREIDRRALIDDQLKEMLDKAAKPDDSHGIVNMLRAILTAEVWSRNQAAIQRYDDAMSGLVGILEARITAMGGRDGLRYAACEERRDMERAKAFIQGWRPANEF